MADNDSVDPGDDDLLNPGGPDGEPNILAHVLKRTAVVAVIGFALFYTRPLWHGFFYGIVYSPSLLILGGGGLLTALALWYIPPWQMEQPESESSGSLFGDDEDIDIEMPFSGTGSQARKVRVFGSIIAVLFFISIIYSIPAGMLEQRTLAEQTMADGSELEEFPQINADNPRVVPREVADVTTRGSVSYRTHRLGTSDIARTENGSLAWSYPIQPDGLRNMLVENQRGVYITEMTDMVDRNRSEVSGEFEVGEGMLLHRSSDWNLKKTDFWAQYNDDAVEFSHDGTPYMYYPKTGHEWHLTPIPHTTPKWEGGALVHPNGTIEHLSQEEAQESEILDGQRLHPLTLTKDKMESLSYRNGIVNQLPVVGAHEGEIEVADLPDDADNDQPFVVDLEGERMTYIMAMEPYGSDTTGLDEVWFTDAETGQLRYFTTEERETFIGPERAMGIARSEDSQTDWGDNFVVTEPIPVTVEGELWWHLKVTPTDFTAVTRNVFVNADTEDAVEAQNDGEIREFLAGNLEPDDLADVGDGGGADDGDGGGADDGDTDTGDGETGDETVDRVIVIVDSNGNVVQRIPISADQDINIQAPDNDGETNETAASG